MIGLMKKDFYVSKKQATFVSLLVILLCFQAIYTSDLLILTAISCMMPFTIMMSSFAYDEMSFFNRYALTFPISKLDIVLSKYLFVGILHAIVGVSLFIINLLFTEDNQISLFLLENSFFVSLLLTAIIIPILFAFGTQKSRIVLLLFLIFPSGLNVFVDVSSSNNEQLILNVLSALPITTAFLLLLSVALSVVIVQKKEF